MTAWGRIWIVVAVLVMLPGIALPPVIEDQLEAGFCDVNCPVQHAGHATAIVTPRFAFASARMAPVPGLGARDTDVSRRAPGSLDAPRAPPSIA